MLNKSSTMYCTSMINSYTCTHTCSKVQDAVVLIIDCQYNVCHCVCDLVICGQVKWSHTDWSDHILNFWVVSDDSKVLDVVVTSCSRVFADTLGEEVMLSFRTWPRS